MDQHAADDVLLFSILSTVSDRQHLKFGGPKSARQPNKVELRHGAS